jgi:uncharacterized protein (DUF1778 family)
VRKNDRVELRVDPSTKQRIERAMAVPGRTAADLGYEGDRRVLEEQERMVLTGSDRAVFVEAIANPLPPTRKLVAALKRHRRLFG